MDPLRLNDATLMQHAILLGKNALSNGEFPVGCVIVAGSEIIAEGARASSTRDNLNEVDHAEIIALKNAYEHVGGWPAKVGPLTCYVTLEPCLMCLGALLINGVRRIVFGYEDVMGGAGRVDFSSNISWRNYKDCKDYIVDTKEERGLFTQQYIYDGSQIVITGGFLRQSCLRLFKDFFKDNKSSYLKGTLLEAYTLNCV